MAIGKRALSGGWASGHRRLLVVVGAAACVGGALGSGGPSPPPTDAASATGARPNIVVVMTDDQARSSMPVMRNAKALIGARGVSFQRSFVNYSLCCPSRATFLTGQYMHNHRVAGNTPPSGGFSRFEALHANNNLAVWLHRAGYYTALVGKYLNGYRGTGVPPGWERWVAFSGDHRAWDNTAYFRYELNVTPAPASFRSTIGIACIVSSA